MTVYVTAHMRIRDTAWMKEYQTNVRGLLAEYGGQVLARSVVVTRLEGAEDHAPDRITILTFPDVSSATAFFSDARYKPYHQLRVSGSSSDVFMFENALDGEASGRS